MLEKYNFLFDNYDDFKKKVLNVLNNTQNEYFLIIDKITKVIKILFFVYNINK